MELISGTAAGRLLLAHDDGSCAIVPTPLATVPLDQQGAVDAVPPEDLEKLHMFAFTAGSVDGVGQPTGTIGNGPVAATAALGDHVVGYQILLVGAQQSTQQWHGVWKVVAGTSGFLPTINYLTHNFVIAEGVFPPISKGSDELVSDIRVCCGPWERVPSLGFNPGSHFLVACQVSRQLSDGGLVQVAVHLQYGILAQAQWQVELHDARTHVIQGAQLLDITAGVHSFQVLVSSTHGAAVPAPAPFPIPPVPPLPPPPPGSQPGVGEDPSAIGTPPPWGGGAPGGGAGSGVEVWEYLMPPAFRDFDLDGANYVPWSYLANPPAASRERPWMYFEAELQQVDGTFAEAQAGDPAALATVSTVPLTEDDLWVRHAVWPAVPEGQALAGALGVAPPLVPRDTDHWGDSATFGYFVAGQAGVGFGTSVEGGWRASGDLARTYEDDLGPSFLPPSGELNFQAGLPLQVPVAAVPVDAIGGVAVSDLASAGGPVGGIPLDPPGMDKPQWPPEDDEP